MQRICSRFTVSLLCKLDKFAWLICSKLANCMKISFLSFCSLQCKFEKLFIANLQKVCSKLLVKVKINFFSRCVTYIINIIEAKGRVFEMYCAALSATAIYDAQILIEPYHAKFLQVCIRELIL